MTLPLTGTVILSLNDSNNYKVSHEQLKDKLILPLSFATGHN